MAKSSSLTWSLLGQMATKIMGRLQVKILRCTGPRFHPSPPNKGRRGRFPGKSASLYRGLACLLLSGVLLSGFDGIAGSQPRGLLPGEKITLGQCLQFSVMDMRDRDGVLDQFDWITVRVENDCAESRRFLVVQLVVIDPVGRAYGGKLWVLGRGELLRPGGAKTERYAVPDPGNRTPHRWLARLVYVQGPGIHRNPPQPRTLGKLKARQLKTRQHKSRSGFQRIR